MRMIKSKENRRIGMLTIILVLTVASITVYYVFRYSATMRTAGYTVPLEVASPPSATR